MKTTVDNKTKYAERNEREGIKAELRVALILLLGQYDYPPDDRGEVYKKIFEQAENFKRYHAPA